jgi:hypothetical protein
VKSTTRKPGLFAKVQAYAFYALRCTSKSAWNDGLEDWKALAVMSLAMGSVALAIVSSISICLQHRVLLPSGKVSFVTLWSMVMIGFLVFNHYSLVFERRWSRFEREFEHQSNVMKVIGSITVWVTVILIVLATEWTGSIAFKIPPS